MENYDKLKALIKTASFLDLFEPVRYCPGYKENVSYDTKRILFSPAQCPHQKEMYEPSTIQLINVLHTLWMADAELSGWNFLVSNNGEFTKRDESGKGQIPMNIFWNRADDNLDHQSDEVKQLLIDYLINDSRNAQMLKYRIELNRESISPPANVIFNKEPPFANGGRITITAAIVKNEPPRSLLQSIVRKLKFLAKILSRQTCGNEPRRD